MKVADYSDFLPLDWSPLFISLTTSANELPVLYCSTTKYSYTTALFWTSVLLTTRGVLTMAWRGCSLRPTAQIGPTGKINKLATFYL